MRINFMASLATGAIALCSSLALAQGGTMDPAQQEERNRQMQQGQQGGMQQGQMQQDQAQQGMVPMTGVVLQVDKKAKTMTIVTPMEQGTEISKLGDTLIVDRERNLIAVRAPISPDTAVMRDGKSAQIGSIKEGDIVRTSFNSDQFSFSDVRATSQKEIDKNLKEMRKELKQDVKQMEKETKDMP